MSTTRRDDPVALRRSIDELQRRNDELRHALAAAHPDEPAGVPTLEEAVAAAKAHELTVEPNQIAPTTARPDEVLDQRLRDLDEASHRAERRAIAAQRTLAYEPPQLKFEIFAPDERGGVGWRLSIVGSAERADQAQLRVETLLPAYDRLMELIEEGRETPTGDRRRRRGRMAK